MALTRGQLGTRSLRSGDVTIKLSGKRPFVGRSYRRTTVTLRHRVSIQTDRTQLAVENSTTPRCESTSVLYAHEALPGIINDPVTRPSTSSSLLSPTPPAPSLQPDKSGRITHGDFYKAAGYLAPTACLNGMVSVHEANIGIPEDGA